MKRLTKPLQNQIKKEMIRGYKDETNKRQYPKLKEAADYHDVSYDALKQYARKWNWQEERTKFKNQVHRKVEEKKLEDKISEQEAEEEATAIVVEDGLFNDAANKLRRVIVKEIKRIDEGKLFLYSLKDGTQIFGVPNNASYYLMNLGKALESAQKVSKVAIGEPSDISKVEGTSNNQPINEFNRIMDKALENLDEPVQHEE